MLASSRTVEQGLARLGLAELAHDDRLFLLREMHWRLWPRHSPGLIRRPAAAAGEGE